MPFYVATVMRIAACTCMQHYRYSKCVLFFLSSIRFVYSFDCFSHAKQAASRRHSSFISHIWCSNLHTICFPELECYKNLLKGLRALSFRYITQYTSYNCLVAAHSICFYKHTTEWVCRDQWEERWKKKVEKNVCNASETPRKHENIHNGKEMMRTIVTRT